MRRQRAVLVYQIQSYEHGSGISDATDFSYASSGRTSPSTACPTRGGIGDRYRIARRSSRSPAAGTCYRVGLRLGEPELPALLVSHRRPASTCAFLRGHIQAGDQIVKTRTGRRADVADTDALLYLPHRDPGQNPRALKIPALSPAAGLVPRTARAAGDGGTADAPPRGDAGSPSRAGLGRFPGVRVARVVPGEHGGCPRSTSRRGRTALPGGRPPVPDAAHTSGPGAAPRCAATRCRRIPAPAPTGSASSASPHAWPAATWAASCAGARSWRRPRPGDRCRCWRRPGAAHLRGIGLTPVLSMLHELAAGRDVRFWWIHGARGPLEHPLAAEAHGLLASLPAGREHVFYSAATPRERDAPAPPPDACRKTRCRAGRSADRAHTSAGRPVHGRHPARPAAIGLDAARIHAELFGARPRVNPAYGQAAERPTRRPALPDPPDGDLAPAASPRRSPPAIDRARARRRV